MLIRRPAASGSRPAIKVGPESPPPGSRLLAWAVGVGLFIGGLVMMYHQADLYHSPKPPFGLFVHGLLFYAGFAAAAFGVLLCDHLAPNDELRAKLARIQPAAGKSLDEVRVELGPEASAEQLADGRSVLTWDEGFYRVKLAFRGTVCEGISGETFS